MVKRVLITSPFEETWPPENDDTPVLFLGEWCKLYARKERWSEMNAETVSYHWDDRKKYHADYRYIDGFYEKVLKALAVELNTFHKTQHTLRYWRILIGPWVAYFVQILFDRWSMLTKALNEYDISCVYVLGSPIEQVVPSDMAHFQKLFVDDFWNEAMYQGILKRIPGVSLKKSASTSVYKLPGNVEVDNQISFKSKIIKSFGKGVNKVSSFFIKPTDSFFISSFLPAKTAILLQLKMGQIPKFWDYIVTPKVPFSAKHRKFSIKKYVAGNDFESIAADMIIEHIPTIYLEGYRELQKKVDELPWPKRPRLMFTANSYSIDDVFKAWAAQNTERGSELIVAQHGGNFGIGAFAFFEEHQIAISDKFISWGWTKKQDQHVKPFANLVVMNKKQGWNPNGNLLLVTMSMPRYSYHLFASPLASQVFDYFEDQYQFVRTLPPNIQNDVLVRLSRQDFGLFQIERWLDTLPQINLNAGSDLMSDLISNCRLFVSSYNATTVLESLAFNVPSIIFWNPDHWELRKEALQYFDALKRVGIFHETPESASAKVAEVWQNVSEWWRMPEVQKVREEFCEYYSHSVTNPVTALYNILKSPSKN